MQTLKILYAMLLVLTVGFTIYTENRLDDLHDGLKNTREKHFTLVGNLQGSIKDIEMLQEKVYYDMIGKGKGILAEKLDMLSDRIYFVEIHYSTDGSYVKSIEYMISGDCRSIKESYSCETFFVDVHTGVISKF